MRYHWIITVQVPINVSSSPLGPTTSRIQTVTMSNTIDELPQGATRADVFNDVVAGVGAQLGTTNLNVMFFALEPNEL